MYGYEAVADALVKEGVRDIFAVIAEDNMDMLIELTDNKGVRLISARNERGAAAMADGYSRVTGGPGICTVTLGPGLTNTATSLITAKRHRSPVICLTTEQPDIERHYVDKGMWQRPFAESTAEKYIRVRHVETLAEDIYLAFRYVRSGQGPVIFAVPPDIMKGKHDMEWEYSPVAMGNPEQQRIHPDPEAIARAAAILGEAERPVILAGRGAFESGADEEIRILAERTGALLATTLLAKEYLADHPYNVGIAGRFATDTAHSLLSECDCVVAVGCSLSNYATEYGLLFPEARIIHIDQNLSQIGDILPVSLGIVGDARASLTALDRELDRQGFVKKRGFWNDNIKSRIETSRSMHQTSYVKAPDTIDPRQLVAEMDKIIPRERIVVIDSGHFMFFVPSAMSVPGPSHFIWTCDFGSVGMGLYQGIGAAVGRPEQHVVVFTGDGGFMMSLEELDTAVRHRIPMTVIILNDNAYGAEVHMLEPQKKPIKISLFDNPDFAEVARALGAIGLTVRKAEDLQAVAAKVGKADRPVLVDAKVNRDVVHEVFLELTAISFGR